mmetsp:Transcript_31112/g.58364  ORF Transcript_31112/g.58364 Transcript_31112/m.58364 type:complete len:216 (+) Transcript_31112:44-691(+)
MAAVQNRNDIMGNDEPEGGETPRDSSGEQLSNLKLVFGVLERGLPSLQRGWRTPDPSPGRTGLPKCAPFAEFVEETDEVLAPARGRSRDPKEICPAYVAPSAMAPPEPTFCMESLVQQMAKAAKVVQDAEDVKDWGAAEEGPVECGKILQHPLCISLGSEGHPFTCNAPCKYAHRGKGCKDGGHCDHCHLCKWKKTTTQNHRRSRKSRGQKPEEA